MPSWGCAAVCGGDAGLDTREFATRGATPGGRTRQMLGLRSRRGCARRQGHGVGLRLLLAVGRGHAVR